MSHPRQSKPLGWFLMVMAGVFVIAIAVFFMFFLPLRGALAGGIQGLAPLLMLFIGVKLIVLGRKKKASLAEEVLEKDKRPPIIYLRPFIIDKFVGKRSVFGFQALRKTKEEKLAKALRAIGPFITVGRPGERTPELGAARMYIDDESWREEVTKLIKKASLVLLEMGEGEGVLWEIQRALNLVKPQRLILCVAPFYIRDEAKNIGSSPEHGTYKDFCKITSGLFSVPLPKEIQGAQFICFDNKWNPILIEPAKSFDAKRIVKNPRTKIGQFQISTLELLKGRFR